MKKIEILSIFRYNDSYISKNNHKKKTHNKHEGKYTMDKKLIEEKANSVLKKVKYEKGELDIIYAANILGFTVGISELPNWDDGFILIDNNKEDIHNLTGQWVNKVIGVNADRNLETKRFIIAHEIGHYMLHYNKTDNVLYARRENIKGKDAEENDADYFAACLLMPQKQFKEKYECLKNKNLSKDEIITLLQKYFNTPCESVKRRFTEIA